MRVRITRPTVCLLAAATILTLASCGDVMSSMLGEIAAGKEAAYAVGDVGPAGGWIFYDAGDYDTYGWRYLEAGPADLGPSVWGSYYLSTGATDTAIGAGSENTRLIVANDTGTTDKAADLCAEYSLVNEGVTYDDWFLPSKDELELLYENLYLAGIDNLSNCLYWSSSEEDAIYVWQFHPQSVDGYIFLLMEKNYISFYSRPVRSF
jgi:hypothetical protein